MAVVCLKMLGFEKRLFAVTAWNVLREETVGMLENDVWEKLWDSRLASVDYSVASMAG